MIRVYLSENFIGMALDVAIVQVMPDRKMIYRPATRETLSMWENIPEHPTVDFKPSFSIGAEEARALFEALAQHFHGADDARALRADYNDERKRVDKLTDAIVRVAMERA